ncbi:Crp/Fnr family transcriptional regulator [Azoarcus olearius]|uniref:Dnr-like transcriptional activator n=1 Tax=Azoarcus sp. (strain BH72) TaxID=418699 RepID=A1K2M2_AZOSB|nr:Crp/Fnr family transcriptional regulator [Azoarcus olearius]ANQ83547.1 putative Dnr-like transcriptional activator [Azoarcus olearius]CAL93077.1 putative Dnr-like transcriptional activator [Azoarcus olearius]
MDIPTAPDWPQRPAFEAMPPALRAAARRRAFRRGETLFATGAAPREMFFILRGEVRLSRLSPDGTETVMQRARDAFLAEASLESHTYHCSAIAGEDGLALVFPLAEFRRSLADSAAFRAQWMSHLLQEVRKRRAQCERLALRSARARILHYIEAEGADGELHLPGSRKALAAELGLTHEALYRALARLTRDGTLEVGADFIRRR